MISLKFVDADRGFNKAITALAFIAASLCAAGSSRAGGHHASAQFHANHRYAIQPNQYSRGRPSPEAPHFGFFPTLWRRWPGLWAVAGAAEPSRAQPERAEPQPTELPSEALQLPSEVPDSIVLPKSGDVIVEEGPPRPPMEPESQQEPLLPPSAEEPDVQPPSEQPETEPAPPTQAPSEPELPPELRETLPPPEQPESEPLPIPGEEEEMPPDEPEDLLGRAKGPKLLSATASSGWTARSARPRRGGAVSRIDRPTPASFSLPTVSTPLRRAPMAMTHPLGRQISPNSRKDSELRIASLRGRANDSVSGSRARDDRPSADRIQARPTDRSVGNPLRRESPTSNDQRTAPTELIFHNPLRNKRREE